MLVLAVLIGGCSDRPSSGDGSSSSTSSESSEGSSSRGGDASSTGSVTLTDGETTEGADSTGTTGAGIDDPGCPECIVLADGLLGGRSIAVDTDFVYFTDQSAGVVARVHKGGGSGATLVEEQDQPYGIAVGGGHVYWTNFAGGEVMRVEASGGTPAQVHSIARPRSVAVSGDYVYWATFDSGSGEVFRRPTSLVTPAESIGYDSGGIADISVDGDTLYFTSHDNSDPANFIEDPPEGPPEGSVQALRPTGDPVEPFLQEVVASDQAEPWGIAHSGTSLVWANGDGTGSFLPHNVVTAPSAGDGAATSLASAQSAPWGVAADEQHAYFTDNDQVKAVPLAGGEVIVLAEQQNQARGIVVDEQWVFWVTADRVLQRPKL